MGRAGSAFLKTASSKSVRHKPCQREENKKHKEITVRQPEIHLSPTSQHTDNYLYAL